MMKIEIGNSYLTLPDRFFSRVDPEPAPEPRTVAVNATISKQLGFEPDWLTSNEGAEFITGNRILEGCEPVALAYAGHQFGQWVPRLGDGRAVLLGEVVDENGDRYDLQLKGSGRTPYSRRGDGRAPLGPVLRELLVSDAMAALDVPTTRVLAAAKTGEFLYRDRQVPGAVHVRVAKSHIRIGTFEYFAARGDSEAVRRLVDYAIERHYPTLPKGAVVDLFQAVADRQADLMAKWQLLGFVHGVMNTDNMLISGETIDYGPCAFINEYDPATVFSSIDQLGRYAYGNQPAIAQWNLVKLAQALLVGAEDTPPQKLQEVIDAFPGRFRDAYNQGMVQKLGLKSVQDGDGSLIEELLELIYESKTDYTLTFRGLMKHVGGGKSEELEFSLPQVFEGWLERWGARRSQDGRSNDEVVAAMEEVNPVFIPRNHLVEAALEDAVNNDDFARFRKLREVLSEPHHFQKKWQEFALPPEPDERVTATFCGT